jgi:cell division FtsZ-interacting protein ZapD
MRVARSGGRQHRGSREGFDWQYYTRGDRMRDIDRWMNAAKPMTNAAAITTIENNNIRPDAPAKTLLVEAASSRAKK